MNNPILTIGMAVHDDLDGVYFTTQGIRMFHPEVLDKVEILILDNNPESERGKAVADFVLALNGGAKYFPYDEWKSTAVRDMLFREARGEYVLCLDSHILVEAGAIAKLIDFYQQNPYCGDLIQGPMLYDAFQPPAATHFDYTWQCGMLGIWGHDPRGQERDAEPFEIPMQGLGLFSCRKDGWLGFNRLFQGFGGEEWYIHEKYRQRGRKTLCLPFLRWTHRFRRPEGVNYRLEASDRIYNYYVGHLELGADVSGVTEHFKDSVGEEHCLQLLAKAKNDLALQPLRLDNSAPEIPVITCLVITNSVSTMHLNEIVESFHRQYYPAREMVIFNDGPNVISCSHPLVKVVNCEEGLASLDECVRTALPACNGDIISLWDPHAIELPWRLSIDKEVMDKGFEYWKAGNYWRGEADGIALTNVDHNDSVHLSCVFRRSWLAENSLSLAPATEYLETTRMCTIVRKEQYPNTSGPLVVNTGWRMNYAKSAGRAAINLLNALERDTPLKTFVAVCDVVDWAKLTVEELSKFDRLEIVLVDDASTNPAMIDYLNSVPYEVIRMPKRLGPGRIWSAGIQRAVNGLYLAAHSFYDFSDLPDDTVSVLQDALDAVGIGRCGITVRTDDLPECNESAVAIIEREQVHREIVEGDYYVTDAGAAMVMARSDRLSERYDSIQVPERRLRAPYQVRFRPWYLDLSDRQSLSVDVIHFIESSDAELYSLYAEGVCETA